ncbi:MAG TPA: hypothetical protein VLA19_11080, partial [Herpetosiphonaceae bacterium]|nr:hypothetical protein [Herpetosiphonaceae bacterium]
MGRAHTAPAQQPPTGHPPRVQNLAEAKRLLAAQDREIRRLRATVAALEAANARVTRRKWWTEDLDRVPHTVLSGNQKGVLRILYSEQEKWADRERTGPQRIYCEGLARELGISRDTLTRAFRELDALGVLTHRTSHDPVTKRNRTTIELHAPFFAPATITRPEPRHHGGARPAPRCPDCDPA